MTPPYVASPTEKYPDVLLFLCGVFKSHLNRNFIRKYFFIIYDFFRLIMISYKALNQKSTACEFHLRNGADEYFMLCYFSFRFISSKETEQQLSGASGSAMVHP